MTGKNAIIPNCTKTVSKPKHIKRLTAPLIGSCWNKSLLPFSDFQHNFTLIFLNAGNPGSWNWEVITFSQELTLGHHANVCYIYVINKAVSQPWYLVRTSCVVVMEDHHSATEIFHYQESSTNSASSAKQKHIWHH